MQKATTYFEQIPVEVVKQIAALDIPDNVGADDRALTVSACAQVEAAGVGFAYEGSFLAPVVDETDAGILYPGWQKPYQQALLELDPKVLQERIVVAESAIKNRLLAIAGNANNLNERLAIEDALSSLRVLKRDLR